MRMIPLFLIVLGFLLLPSASSTAEEPDIAKALTGKWEGEFSRGIKDRGWHYERTLVIDQVHQQDGKWIIGAAKWGRTGETLHPIQVTLELQGGVPTLQLRIPNPRHNSIHDARLRLTDHGFLVGMLYLDFLEGCHECDPTRLIKLKKVE